MLLLLETPWVRSEHDPERRLVRYTRTALGFSTIIELEQSYGALILSTQQMDRTRLGLLVDLREAPPRNDPTFEQVMGVYRSRMMRPFGRVATLVRSAVGKLQVRRHMQDDGVSCLVTQDEQEALRYLEGG